MTYDEWRAELVDLRRRWLDNAAERDRLRWLIGDALRAGDQFGEIAADAFDPADAAGPWAPGVLRNLKYVAGAVPPSLRSDSLGWAYHAAVAGLVHHPDTRATGLTILDEAKRRGLSLADVRALVRDVRRAQDGRPVSDPDSGDSPDTLAAVCEAAIYAAVVRLGLDFVSDAHTAALASECAKAVWMWATGSLPGAGAWVDDVTAARVAAAGGRRRPPYRPHVRLLVS